MLMHSLTVLLLITAVQGDIERLSPTELRIGNIRIDTEKHEISIPGIVNSASALEFVASTKGGGKKYESAIELDTTAVTFNTALILLGLDSSRAEPSRYHFDPNTPKGDSVEIWIEWKNDQGATRRVPAEEIVYSNITKRVLQKAQWVYTGSGFLPNGQYLAERDGVLIGFVHDPASVIENASSDGIGRFGSFVLNPSVNLKPDQPVTVTVRAIVRPDGK